MSSTTLLAFKKMRSYQATSVAVVDDNNVLINVVTANHLRGLNRRNVHLVLKPALAFISELGSEEREEPRTCGRELPFSRLMERFADGVQKVVFVLGDQGQPVGAVTMSDLLSVLVE